MTDLPPDAQWPPPEPRNGAVQDFTRDRVEEDAALSVEVARDASGPPLQWPLVTVLVGLVVSLIVVADDHFRRGSVLFAAFVVLAFFLRLFLPERDAGWLAVRSRRIDLLCLAFLGIGLSVFALIVPPPS
jgi:hypothetical protein